LPELPDIAVYVACLRERVVGATLERVRVLSPFLLRTVEPPLAAVAGRVVRDVRRLGKRVVFGLDVDLFIVLHLMVAGRLQWKAAASPKLPKSCLAVFEFSSGVLLLTEAGTKKRAALYVVRGIDHLAQHDLRGLEVLEAQAAEFTRVLRSQNRTLKRALTDPHLFSGIGNAYSDEILHAARLSPVQLTSRLTDAEAMTLFAAAQSVLTRWRDELIARFRGRFPGPGDVTAIRAEFAVHGRYGKRCGACGDTVQRIRYAENETNYCPTCQTGGRVLADRSLSRLLKDDWPGQARRDASD